MPCNCPRGFACRCIGWCIGHCGCTKMSQSEVSASQESISSSPTPDAPSTENLPYATLSQTSSAYPVAPLRPRFTPTDHHTYMLACLSRLEGILETLESSTWTLRDSVFTRTFRCAGLYSTYSDMCLSMENSQRKARTLVYRVKQAVHRQQRSRRQLFRDSPY